MKRVFAVLLCLLPLFSLTASAQTTDVLEGLDLPEVQASEVTSLSLKELVKALMQGELSFSPKILLEKGAALFLGQLQGQLGLMRNLLLLALVSALLQMLNASFRGKAVGDLGFYVCYAVLILQVVTSFGACTDLVTQTADRLYQLTEGLLPAFTALCIATGRESFALVVSPVILGASQLLLLALRKWLLPGLSLAAVLALVNHLSERKLLSELTRGLQTAFSWLLKGSVAAYVALLSVIKLGTPALGKLAGKTAKTVVDAVPIVGETMSGAVELASALAGMTGNTLAVGAAVFLFFLSLVPVLRLLVMALVYKASAALAEPVAEGRLIKALSAAGDFTFLLLGALFAADAFFLFAALAMVTVF